MLPKRLTLRDNLTAITSSQTKMQLRSGESEVIYIRGNAVAKLIPALLHAINGSRTWPEVMQTLEHVATPEVIKACIDQLFEHGILMEVTAESEHLSKYETALARFFSHPPFPPQEILKRIRNATIGTFCENILEETLICNLREHGFNRFMRFNPDLSKLQTHLAKLDLLIVLTPQMEASTLDDINLACIKAETPWLPVDVYSGPFCSLGPLVVPGSGPCYECYRSRIRSNLGPYADAYDEFLEFQRAKRINVSHYGMLPAATNIALSFACLEALKLITELHLPACIGHNLVFDITTLAVTRHRVLQVPRCPACSGADMLAQGHWTV